MTADNRTVRAAIVESLDGINGLHVYEYPVDAIQVPAAVVVGLEHTLSSFDGGRASEAVVAVLVSHNHVDQMAALDDLVDIDTDESVVGALESATFTNGVSLAVTSVGDFGVRLIGETSYYGANVVLRVWT